SLEMGAGSSYLQLAGLSLTGLDVKLGAGKCTVDLSGDWARDLDAAINTGAADITVLLPRDVSVRVEVAAGVGRIESSGLKQDGYVYANEAYGTSEVNLHINILTGIGQINLEVVE
ncbi:MAG: LiaF domain-containing protein, partial [Omnitrophica WOR_2 bacterium]